MGTCTGYCGCRCLTSLYYKTRAFESSLFQTWRRSDYCFACFACSHLLFFTPSFFQRYCSIGFFFPREIRVAFPEKASCDRIELPNLLGNGCFSVSIIHRTLTWTTGSLSCAQMFMHAIAQRCVRTPKESLHRKLTLRRKSLAAPGNRNCVGGVTIRCANQLDYIPSQVSQRLRQSARFSCSVVVGTNRKY